MDTEKCAITYVITETEQSSIEVEIGAVISAPEVSLDGHTLCGWYTEAEFVNEWNFADPVTEDMTLYARWQIGRAHV